MVFEGSEQSFREGWRHPWLLHLWQQPLIAVIRLSASPAQALEGSTLAIRAGIRHIEITPQSLLPGCSAISPLKCGERQRAPYSGGSPGSSGQAAATLWLASCCSVCRSRFSSSCRQLSGSTPCWERSSAGKRSPAMPTAQAPACRYSAALAKVTPPVGIKGRDPSTGCRWRR